MEQETMDFNKMVEFAYRIVIKKDDSLRKVDELFCETFGELWKAKILLKATLSKFDFNSIKYWNQNEMIFWNWMIFCFQNQMVFSNLPPKPVAIATISIFLLVFLQNYNIKE